MENDVEYLLENVNMPQRQKDTKDHEYLLCAIFVLLCLSG